MKTIAFFRGINVGGKNTVKMAGLREMFAGLGLKSVKTYIQSGNALFDTDETEAALAPKIERGFAAAFGFDSAVVLRTEQELAGIINNIPFSAEEIAEAEAAANGAESLYCYLLPQAAPVDEVNAVCAAYDGKDRFVASWREIYLLCHQSIRDTKLPLQKLKTPATARNLKTLRKLYELAREPIEMG
jgi:uncharacterized protein (DUF1697 family)